MHDALARLWPEVALFLTTCVVMVVGLSPNRRLRVLTPWFTALGLVIAIGLGLQSPTTDGAFPQLMGYAKPMIGAIGLILLPLAAGVVDRDLDALVESGKMNFNPLRATRAEFYAFFLFSLTGLMLVASADDLIWLFLALELTSLPTYIMVVLSTRGTRSQEAGVKYFFLGALGAAIFLYGFAMLYGAAGSTNLGVIAAHFEHSGLDTLGTLGLLLALVGVSFKIAAFPMHFYTPDVYQGAASPVSAFLAFVPKTAGFLAMMLLLGVVGWSNAESGGLPVAVEALLWIVAALSMTVGNALACLQTSVKRMLAYSSIAHSGYMLVGLIVGPGESFTNSGLAAVLYYLLCYGVMNTGVFAVIASLEKADGSEPDELSELSGLARTHPVRGWIVIVCTLSLLGFPPLLGFIGKVGLFSAGVSGGQIPLVVILGINSAIAAFYYLRLVTTVYLDPRDDDAEQPRPVPRAMSGRPFAATVSAAGVLVLIFLSNPLIQSAETAATQADPTLAGDEPAEEPTAVTLADPRD
ncbi:MAG: NADH-quinone oxidoreductase subunit N [Phycisphaerales bacterium JB040]